MHSKAGSQRPPVGPAVGSPTRNLPDSKPLTSHLPLLFSRPHEPPVFPGTLPKLVTESLSQVFSWDAQSQRQGQIGEDPRATASIPAT